MADEIIIETTSQEVIEVGVPGPQGPAGAAGTGLETLTIQGDTLYRGASTGQRLPIGTVGQILKVSAGGIPEWGAAPASGVASVNGETGAVTLDGSDIDTSGNDDLAAFVTYEFADGNGLYYPLPDSTLNNKRVYRTTTGHHVFFQSLRWHITDGSPITANIIESSDDDNAAWPWLSAWDGSIEKAQLSTVVGRARSTFLFVGDSIPNSSVSGLSSVAASGAYNDLTGKPTLGTASTKDAPTTGNASSTQVVLGNDTRLSDSRTPTAHSHTLSSEITTALAEDPDNCREALNLGDMATEPSSNFSTVSHTHGNITSDGKVGSTSGLPVVTTTAGAVTTLALGTAGQVLQVNSGATGVEFAAASGGGVSAVGTSTADVLSVSGSNLIADDGGTIDSSDPFIKWDDAAGKLVYANPLRRTSSGAFYVGLAPTTTALGTNAVNIQASRTTATQVASAADSVAIGSNTTAQNFESVAIGKGANAGNSSVAIGTGSSTFNNPSGAVAIGRTASAGGLTSPIAIGWSSNASSDHSIAIGQSAASSQPDSVAIGLNTTANLRSMVATRPFNAVYWSGQTTTNAATVLNLDGTATNRFTIAASTALAVDILLVARRATTQDKWLVARRFLGIRRDATNPAALIGDVQTLGIDQKTGSPTWSFTLTADTGNNALQLQVTGETGETVEWRATAFYRVA